MLLRPATIADAAATAEIYNHEVLHTTATFDLRPRSVDEQAEWLGARSGALEVIVADLDGEVAGFASLSQYKPRPAYNGTVEDSIYLHRDHRGKGLGRALLGEIVEVAANRGFHTVIGRVEVSGTASVRLHEALGFELVGVEREVGRKFGRWLDVAILQKMLR